MRKPLFMVGNFLLLFLVLFLSVSVFANERIMVPRVWNKFDPGLGVAEWTKRFGNEQYSFVSPQGTNLQFYSAYDEKNLYLGFLVTDSYLTYADDYSMDFRGSDHLRLYLKVDKWQHKDNLLLYLLPTSKIREPLLKISGLSWHRSAFKVNSVLEKRSYFVTISISLEELKLFPLPGERIMMNCLIHDKTQNGAVEKSWLSGEKATDQLTLIFQ